MAPCYLTIFVFNDLEDQDDKYWEHGRLEQLDHIRFDVDKYKVRHLRTKNLDRGAQFPNPMSWMLGLGSVCGSDPALT